MRTETRSAETNPHRLTMSLDHLLKRRGIGSEDSQRLKRAFNLALNALYLVDRNDPISEIVAQKIIEIGWKALAIRRR